MNCNDRSRLLNYYFTLCYLLTLAVCSSFLQKTDFHNVKTALFSMAVFLTYGFIYLLPAFIITKLCHYLCCKVLDRGENRRLISALTYTAAVATTAGTILLLYADRTIYNLFGFHFNGFVWNLITTPGGLESMGGSDAATVTYGLIAGGIIVLPAFLLWLLRSFMSQGRLPGGPRKTWVYLTVIFLVLACGERITYGVSHLQCYSPILVTANTYPLYLPLTFRSLAKKMGFNVARKNDVSFASSASALHYPLQPLQVTRPEKPLNIVWLVAESLRWDMLDQEIMPETFAFSRQGRRFTQHYSGGIGTREGMFTMFYGLYGNSWFSFLDERRSPVLMDELQRQGYQMSMYTSARFSYPEFDKTIFARVPGDMLHEHIEQFGWQADQKNITDMLEFLKKRDAARPFMTFMFFESPHARYYFPDESVIRKDYLQDFNYATMSLEKDSGLIFNRYVNACHHQDKLIKRILDFLGQEQLLDNTMVIITGDHGEEFMEKGHWGHNSNFVEEQSRVPLVLYVPGMKPAVVDRMTSHLDLPATVMKLLGVANPPQDYSMGFDLLGDEQRPYTIMTDWTRICYVDSNYKAVYPHKGPPVQSVITTKNDLPVADEAAFNAASKNNLVQVMGELGRFTR
ncbi:MAG: sulfatase-like hydrolase/transferase [Thermodesulfobacteriota bacterium]